MDREKNLPVLRQNPIGKGAPQTVLKNSRRAEEKFSPVAASLKTVSRKMRCDGAARCRRSGMPALQDHPISHLGGFLSRSICKVARR
jgi:hypothetical protein